MDKLRRFLHDKAVVLVVAGCIVCAACAGIWAIRTIQNGGNTAPQDGTSGADDAGLEQYPGLNGEDNTWNDDMGVAGKAENVPEEPNAASNAASDASSGSSSSPSSSGAQPKSGEPAAAAAPSYTQPVSGSVCKAFSGDNLVYSNTLGDWRTHNGTDFACATGDTVYAPVSGTVGTVTVDGNWGGVVEITDSEQRVWRLCGVSNAAVKSGDAVVTGQQLGAAGTIGCEHSDGTHIHLEISKDGKFTDPASLMG